ncbi:zinc finger protein [Apostichopus japonicus]|uniref:Zinc finger protein n=1 Tax=Stichopus japonicus TaxID=307972 RepID=A0A2G8JG38_STIJA|nr:zinc finger protein [Apostichopus japonicus]
MEPQEEYEITVAVEALRDLRSQNNEGLDSSTTDRNFVSTKEKASVPTTEKASALASASDHGDVIVPGVSSQTVSKDTITTREVSGQAVSDGSGKKRKIVAKNALHETSKALKGLSLPSNLQTVSLAFPLRDSQKKRILLPKPTASSNVVSIPLSSIISQTIGVPQGVHSKSRDTLVSAEHTPDGNREKEMKKRKNRERSFPCLRCSTKTTTRQALWKHKRRFHSHEPQEGKTAERVSCDECDAFWTSATSSQSGILAAPTLIPAVSEIYAKATGLDPATRHLPDSLAYLKQKHIPKDQLERDVLTRMVTELRSRKDNPVLIYKPEGDVEYEMSSEDFVIGIQTQFQRELLKKHANKMICSHVSQGNESFLMTLLVVDKDSNDVIPVCWLLGSVQEDRLFRPFLEALRAKCGNIETDLFVTNLSSALYHVLGRHVF